MMPRQLLPFQYDREDEGTGMTALGGLPAYLDLAYVAGLSRSISRHVRLREGGQGWTDAQVVSSLALLNLAGGSCVDDLRVLEGDGGFCEILRRVELSGLPRKERRGIERRWRKERRRTVPSPSAAFRYLNAFHDPGEESRRKQCREQGVKAFIPSPSEALRGLGRVNADLTSFVQSRSPESVATLDMDATLVATGKDAASFCYKGFGSYQPLNTYWAEQELVLHSEFRDGNVPAGHEQLRVLQEGLEMLPPGVEQVRLRSDTAGYQVELLRYCAEGGSERFGEIEFAIGADVSPEFRAAVAEVPEEDWKPLLREVDGKTVDTGQEWAEVCFVPRWACQNQTTPDYRFLATRELLRQRELPGLETPQESLPFPTMEFGERGRYKVFGIVTNRDLPGDELIWWLRQRCGKSEEVHAVMKEDLAGGQLPSGRFGANAAWWAIMILALNLNVAMKRLVLGSEWAPRRLKAVRFAFIHVPARIVRHARQLLVRLSGRHPATDLLFRARRRILDLALAQPLPS